MDDHRIEITRAVEVLWEATGDRAQALRDASRT
jgi:hypothetical protein